MRAPDLVFWLDVLPSDHRDDVGALCRRHADTMVVPRGWTLDDLRDPDLHLFRPPEPVAPPPRARRETARRAAAAEQLELGASIEPGDQPDPAVVDGAVDPWRPAFNEADDLDGLLSARSPLLARAFRTAERPGA
jgi:hypothetical protein